MLVKPRVTSMDAIDSARKSLFSKCSAVASYYKFLHRRLISLLQFFKLNLNALKLKV